MYLSYIRYRITFCIIFLSIVSFLSKLSDVKGCCSVFDCLLFWLQLNINNYSILFIIYITVYLVLIPKKHALLPSQFAFVVQRLILYIFFQYSHLNITIIIIPKVIFIFKSLPNILISFVANARSTFLNSLFKSLTIRSCFSIDCL